MKIGCVSWAFSSPEIKGIEEVIHRISTLGFEGIELIAMGDMFNKYYTHEKIRELKELIISNGLELSQFV